ncbi:MAG TPA: hypothetical protein VE842_11040, partial [Pyrinomonadaceae bacterium]|nr:hypothetical protein [Pyrinomonadaceae bacterium]
MLGILAALSLALIVAVVLGVVAYYLSAPVQIRLLEDMAGAAQGPTSLFLMFTLFATLYLTWATLPLTIGGGASQFDPGRLLLYPISLRRLFAIDWLSELTSLGSIFAVPAVFAVGLGAGLSNDNVTAALVAAACAALFGLALTKWIATTLGALTRSSRTRGETLLALIGVGIGLGGAFLGQLLPLLNLRGAAFRGMRWTPPGAAATALMSGLRDGGEQDYALALLTLVAYSAVLVAATFGIARRSALGAGGAGARGAARSKRGLKAGTDAGWHLPLLSAPLSAVVEKELRYAVRNAQLRVLVLLPLILIALRAVQASGGDGDEGPGGFLTSSNPFGGAFAPYGEGLMPASWMLYAFMILASVACNLFAYEEGGMRSFLLAPVDRRTILLGKNLAVALLALVLTSSLMIVNELVFRDLSVGALLFIALCFPLFVVTQALTGNLLSMYFPKRLQFGKRMSLTGVAGVLLLPVMVLIAIPPILA